MVTRPEWLGAARVRVLLVCALAGAGLVPVLSRGASWLGSWKMALDWGTSSITLLGPVAAGIACTVYVRIRQAQLPELLSQAARPWLGWVAPAAAVWVLAAAAVLMICALTTTAASATGAHAYPGLSWVVLPALVVLAADIGLGALIGSAVGNYWAAPWAAVAAFTLFVLSSIGVVPGVFDTGGVTGSLSGETFAARVLVLQGVAGLGLAAGAMALSHWELFRVSSLGTRVATGVTVAGTVVALFQLNGDHERYVALDRVAYECAGDRPTICLAQETTRPLDDLAGKMHGLAEHLDAAGVRLPDRFVQRTGTPVVDSGAISMPSEVELTDHVSYSDAAASLATPADCPAYYGDTFPERLFAIKGIVERWILVQDGREPVPAEGPFVGWWASPVTQQHPWIRATYDALRSCRLHALRPPPTTAAQP